MYLLYNAESRCAKNCMARSWTCEWVKIFNWISSKNNRYLCVWMVVVAQSYLMCFCCRYFVCFFFVRHFCLLSLECDSWAGELQKWNILNIRRGGINKRISYLNGNRGWRVDTIFFLCLFKNLNIFWAFVTHSLFGFGLNLFAFFSIFPNKWFSNS